ncbi:PstS family phosphate ABC transporter substrate-binding protein [Marinibaculum pumilum]|uniref:PstS family phosphate ABC transporter substrate-binding protein n=1 Tax=Marinibaculum pumilum TaxID=1766165 RepID=A0ABV7L3A5_9PROT
MTVSKRFLTAALAGAALTVVAAAGAAQAADQIKIVGSSTVYPFSTSVAERFAAATKFPAPIVESTGTGGGMKLFCAGVSSDTPDFTNASRAIKKSEYDNCMANGVDSITEIKIGYDGIVFANSREADPMPVTKEQIFLALAKTVPVDGKLQDNPYKTWKQIDASLPDAEIQVLGPPPTSGTRDAFVELVMEEACDEIAAYKALEGDKKAHKAACTAIREDGAYIDAGENDNLIVSKLVANPTAFGIFGFSFLDQNASKIRGETVEGVEPTFDNIADGKYGVSRSLFVYVKDAHVGQKPGMKEFIDEFTSEKAWGPDGYLAEKGLIPLPDDERKKQRENAMSLGKLTM